MNEILQSILRLKGITSNQIGMIELNSDLEIETVTEIFIRVNSQGVPLSQADFAMSKIAVNETYGGNTLRKAIDYFCHLARSPEFFHILKNDAVFAQSDLYQPLIWMKDLNDELYDPSYTDMLRVAFASEFGRGKLEDLVALLSGRNFETREYEQEIIEDTFKRLKEGIIRFMNQNHFKTFLMILRSAGFVDPSLIGSQNAVNFAYMLYLWLRKKGVPAADIERGVRKWFVFSMLTERYTSSPESTIDFDMRQLETVGFDAFAKSTYDGTVSSAFWDMSLPQHLGTSSTGSPYWRVFKAAQVKLNDHGFLSRDITIKDLIEVKSDEHHLFPQAFLKEQGLTRGQYNQIANLAITQSEINIAIGKKAPAIYLKEVIQQCQTGTKKYGNLETLTELAANRQQNCIPDGMEDLAITDYGDFLAKRRQLMAQKMKTYFEGL